jgi:hypothetical protein
VLETGDWSARVRVARRLLAQSWLPLPGLSRPRLALPRPRLALPRLRLPAGWLAFRTPALPPPHLPRLRLPGALRPWFRLPPARPPGLRRASRRGPSFRMPWPRPSVRKPRLRPSVRMPRLRPAAAAAALTWIIAGLALFTVFLHMSQTTPVNSDGASNALQAWAMLHGNPLLNGWELSDVSFYTTELPQYALLELARGLTPDVIHLAGAMTYTLVVLLAARLARGRAGGAAGLLRAALAAGIMLAPQQNGGVYILMLSPDHTGSTVPVLVTWILLDRAPRRWWVPGAAALLLAWGLVADNIVLITGAAPLAAVGAWRAYHLVARGGQRLRGAWLELSLPVAALAAVGGARLAEGLLKGAGGYYVWPVDNQLAQAGQLGGNLALTARGLLLLFGANFLGHNVGYVAGLAFLHLAGIALAGWAVATVLRRFAGAGLAEQLLVTGVLFSLACYLLGQNALDLHSTREFVAVLPLGAALAGRVLAGRLHAARMTPALALVATAYLLSVGRVIALPAAPPQGSDLASWLAAQHLTDGLGGYWQANAITLESAGQVRVRPVVIDGAGLQRDRWEAQPGWYNPARQQANFVVLSSAWPGKTSVAWPSHVRAAFGQPARVYAVGPYTILVWNKNLLADLPR